MVFLVYVLEGVGIYVYESVFFGDFGAECGFGVVLGDVFEVSLGICSEGVEEVCW